MSLRFTQLVIEALQRPTTAHVRVTQTAVETIARPTSAKARMTQLAIEVISHNGGTGSSSGSGLLIIAT